MKIDAQADVPPSEVSPALQWPCERLGQMRSHLGARNPVKMEASHGTAAGFFVASHGLVSKHYHNGLQVDC